MAFMLGASCGFAAMGALVKVACQDLPTLTVVFARSAVIVVIVSGIAWARGEPFKVVDRRRMLWRCVSGFVAMLCYFYALATIPLGTAISLQYMAPIFVALLSFVVLRERVSVITAIGISAAFAGSALILAPDVGALELGSLAALTSAVLAAFAYLAVRQLRETDSAQMIVLGFAVFAAVASSPGLFLLDRWPTPTEFAALAGVGVFATLGQLGMTHAYRHGEAAFVSAFSYATVLLGTLLGFVLFDEVPTLVFALGGLLIVGSGVAVSLSGRRPKPT